VGVAVGVTKLVRDAVDDGVAVAVVETAMSEANWEKG